MDAQEITISMPCWLAAFEAEQTDGLDTAERRMALAIELAKCNSAERSGGPFGAAVFDMQTGRLVAAGVNRVIPANCSIAHAEMVAIARAQQRLGTYDLAAAGRFELVSSCAPCAMCLGAIPWSGVRSLVCGARDEDARAVGFDEGAKPADWQTHLRQRGIAVTEDILRAAAAEVLAAYAADGGTIY